MNFSKIVAVSSLLTLFAPPKAALAYLEFCNYSTHRTVDIAVVYDDGKGGWIAEGWWEASQGECVRPITGNLHNGRYYFYAQGDGGKWHGDYPFCTLPDNFVLYNPQKCDRGKMKNFQSIDPAGKSDLTIDITD
ncbi:MAG: DUF1036 domain-containing protein [Candidatus Competibacteraceae bacterium]